MAVSGRYHGLLFALQSGRPVMAARVTTVRAADATSAEAWSKALIIRGRDGMQQARAGGLDVLLEDQDRALGRERGAGVRRRVGERDPAQLVRLDG